MHFSSHELLQLVLKVTYIHPILSEKAQLVVSAMHGARRKMLHMNYLRPRHIRYRLVSDSDYERIMRSLLIQLVIVFYCIW